MEIDFHDSPKKVSKGYFHFGLHLFFKCGGHVILYGSDNYRIGNHSFSGPADEILPNFLGALKMVCRYS